MRIGYTPATDLPAFTYIPRDTDWKANTAVLTAACQTLMLRSSERYRRPNG